MPFPDWEGVITSNYIGNDVPLCRLYRSLCQISPVIVWWYQFQSDVSLFDGFTKLL
jgi:hypothetical protein